MNLAFSAVHAGNETFLFEIEVTHGLDRMDRLMDLKSILCGILQSPKP